ncbi:MAG TPA: hypothetical protein PLR20_03190 [Syntrophales bacterium]|nr:hypothetical protein [Syntrophales bacterium]HOX95131.1 hypothetical protein [Syntrophales bacterium]HPI56049.1 hypothetical protein [Syntrophales bacterium]HPN24061.1 hypothetical protein [Syntrophales bacterium]HQM28340.1 hypothetical protein [Syntrophales bacterium]
MSDERALTLGFKINEKSVTTLLLLVLLPNLLGAIQISTPWGFKIHFFQYAIFLAAFAFGPVGGLLSGSVGSLYAAYLMANPYILIGNALLGLATGYFVRRGYSCLVSALLGFAVQIPWIAFTDLFLMNLPASFVGGLIITLTVTNGLWAALAGMSAAPLKRYLE